MRRGRILIFILLIVVIGVVVVAVAFRSLLQTPAQQTPVDVSVYTVGQPIAQGAKITDDHLAKITLPQAMVPPVAYTEDRKAELLTKIAKYPLDQGVIITSSMVADSSQGLTIAMPQYAAQAAALIPTGQTAISIPTSRLSLVGYGVNDGSHVNVNACFLFVDVDPSFQTVLPNKFISLEGVTAGANITLGEGALKENVIGRAELDPSFLQPFYVVPNEPQRGRITCQALFQNVVVLKLGNFQYAATDQAATAATQQQATTNANAPDIVTLLVSPQDAVTLTYLVYTNAQIVMTLRNPSDDSRMATEAATLQFLLSQYNIPVPPKLPYALQPRIDALVAPSLPGDTVTVQPKP